MDINEKDIIILDDDCSYNVVKKVEDDNRKYYYLSGVDNWEKIKFLYEDGNQLVEIEDEEIFENVVRLMMDTIDMSDILDKLKDKLEKTDSNVSEITN